MADRNAAPASAQDSNLAAMVHDPLPESTWFWRRLFIFALTAVATFGIWVMVQAIRDLAANNPQLAVGAFVKIVGWLLLLLWSVITYYLVAPTGEQITRWVQTAGMLKSGVQLATSAAVRGLEGTAQTTTVAGTGAPAAAPAPQPAPAPDVDVAPTSRKS